MLDFLKKLVVIAYMLKGGQANVTVRNQSLVIAVDHWRVLGRAKNYSIKEPDTLDWLDVILILAQILDSFRFILLRNMGCK